MAKKRYLRERFWSWFVYNIVKYPEAQTLNLPLKILWTILFPLRRIRWAQEKYEGLDWMRNIWTIHGIKYSDKLFSHFAFGDDKWFRIVKREDGLVTIETVNFQSQKHV